MSAIQQFPLNGRQRREWRQQAKSAANDPSEILAAASNSAFAPGLFPPIRLAG
jgi:hypothetical protein